MSDNATHYIVHHYLEGSSIYLSPPFYPLMACCIVLGFVVVVLLIFLAVAVYVIIAAKKAKQPRTCSVSNDGTRPLRKRSFKNLMVDDPPSCNVLRTASINTRDIDAEVNTNRQDIPLSIFKKQSKRNSRIAADSSESSTGLCDFLFPERRDSEIVCDPSEKLLAFAGQVLPSGSEISDPGPSASGINLDNASGTLIWDYFQPNIELNQHTVSVASEIEPGVQPSRIQNVCWV